MSEAQSETLTAALRRLGDEHASGVLAVAADHGEVVVELDDGVPVAIGPVDDQPQDAVATAAAVDGLLDRTVAAVLSGDGAWEWDVERDHDRLPLPAGMPAELSRRAVDAAQALALLPAPTVLLPGRPLTAHGTVGEVLQLVDGERTLGAIAEEVGTSVPTTAVLALALVRAGAAATDEEPATPQSWSDAVRRSDAEEADDEPELWVMDAPAEPARPADPAPTAEPARPADPAPTAEPATARTPAGDDPADDDGWNDTSWLQDEPDDEDVAPDTPERTEQRQDARAALSAMLDDLGADRPDAPERTPATSTASDEPATPRPTDEQDGNGARDDGEAAAGTDLRRGRPRAEPGEVAEFLRELSRLALDDDE